LVSKQTNKHNHALDITEFYRTYTNLSKCVQTDVVYDIPENNTISRQQSKLLTIQEIMQLSDTHKN